MENNRLFTKALIYAADKHKDQIRRGGVPYIYHPIKIAEVVKDLGYGVEYQIVALLHDTLEDTDATEEEIREFGEDVLTAVKLLTRADAADENEYIDAILKNHIASVVKNADKFCNMYEACDCEDKQWATRYVEKSKKYYLKKFSSALDEQIKRAATIVISDKYNEEAFSVSESEMKLYSDKEKEKNEHAKKAYEEAKEFYLNNADLPDFNRPDIRFFRGDYVLHIDGYGGVSFYYCMINDRVWSLWKQGWEPIDANGFKDKLMCYPFDYFEMSKENVIAEIKNRVKKGFFYDFVEISRLI